MDEIRGDSHVESSDRFRAAAVRHRCAADSASWPGSRSTHGTPGSGCGRPATSRWSRMPRRTLFKAMHNLRTDRSTTNRLLNAESADFADIEKFLRGIHDAEMPAIRPRARDCFPSIEFAEQATLVPEFEPACSKTLTALQKESWDAMRKPKAARRATLAKEYMERHGSAAGDARQDFRQPRRRRQPSRPRIDQLLAIKQAAWLLRNTAGEASALVSTGLWPPAACRWKRSRPTPNSSGGIEAAWNGAGIGDAGMQLPPDLANAMTATKTAYFDPQYLALRDRLLISADRRREDRHHREPVDPDHRRSASAPRSTSPSARSMRPGNSAAASIRQRELADRCNSCCSPARSP